MHSKVRLLQPLLLPPTGVSIQAEDLIPAICKDFEVQHCCKAEVTKSAAYIAAELWSLDCDRPWVHLLRPNMLSRGLHRSRQRMISRRTVCSHRCTKAASTGSGCHSRTGPARCQGLGFRVRVYFRGGRLTVCSHRCTKASSTGSGCQRRTRSTSATPDRPFAMTPRCWSQSHPGAASPAFLRPRPLHKSTPLSYIRGSDHRVSHGTSVWC